MPKEQQPTRILCSPYLRVIQTAVPTADALDLRIEVITVARELSTSLKRNVHELDELLPIRNSCLLLAYTRMVY